MFNIINKDEIQTHTNNGSKPTAIESSPYNIQQPWPHEGGGGKGVTFILLAKSSAKTLPLLNHKNGLSRMDFF